MASLEDGTDYAMTLLSGIGLIGPASCTSNLVRCILDVKRRLISLVQRLKNQAIYGCSNKEATYKAWHGGRYILIYFGLDLAKACDDGKRAMQKDGRFP